MSKATVVVDNTPLDKRFVAEHGLCIWLEHQGLNLLLDTGMGGALLPNLGVLGLDPNDLDGIILSHGHYDHAGGLEALLKSRNEPIDIWCHANAFGSHLVSRPGGQVIAIGTPLDQAGYEALGARFHFLEHEANPWPGVTLLAQIPRETAFETPRPELQAEVDGEIVPDPFPDDLAVLLEATKGPAVITGCAHSGVINILHLAGQYTNSPIVMLMGGTHLGPADKRQQDETAAALKQMDGLQVVSGHCTLTAGVMLAEVLGGRYTAMAAGMSFEL